MACDSLWQQVLCKFSRGLLQVDYFNRLVASCFTAPCKHRRLRGFLLARAYQLLSIRRRHKGLNVTNELVYLRKCRTKSIRKVSKSYVARAYLVQLEVRNGPRCPRNRATIYCYEVLAHEKATLDDVQTQQPDILFFREDHCRLI